VADEVGDGIPDAGAEAPTVLGALDRVRRTFRWKCGDLGAEGLRTTLGPSTLTVGGLLKHAAFYEDYYFSHLLLGRDLDAWALEDHSVPDWEWRSAAQQSPQELYALWDAAVERSRASVQEALAHGGMDRLASRPNHWGGFTSLRRIVVDVNEEYARHTGHADLIRESIDGRVGEDAPD
jgi:hypothetical protein